jgi:hypothetical protein
LGAGDWFGVEGWLWQRDATLVITNLSDAVMPVTCASRWVVYCSRVSWQWIAEHAALPSSAIQGRPAHKIRTRQADFFFGTPHVRLSDCNPPVGLQHIPHALES